MLKRRANYLISHEIWILACWLDIFFLINWSCNLLSSCNSLIFWVGFLLFFLCSKLWIKPLLSLKLIIRDLSMRILLLHVFFPKFRGGFVNFQIAKSISLFRSEISCTNNFQTFWCKVKSRFYITKLDLFLSSSF